MVNFLEEKLMNVSEYGDASLDENISLDDDSCFNSGISGFEIAYGSGNKTAIKKKTKHKLIVKKRLDMLREKRWLDQETNTLFDEWEH